MKKEINDKEFLSNLNGRRESEVIKTGTIWLQSYEEYKQLAEVFQGKIVKPIHAAKMLGVSRAMVLKLEKEVEVRGFRLSFKDDEIWKSIPLHLKPLITRTDTYIWIPIEDVQKYAESKGRTLKKVKGYYVSEFYG